MTQDEIIEMARQAGWSYMESGMDKQRLEAFAKLVEDAAFKRWAAQTKLAIKEEQDRCCSIIYGMCESDNVAERTVKAIRKGQS